MMTTPVRVLHIIDDLLGGGSQKLLWDLVRFADPAEVQQQVVSLTIDRGQFVYAERLAAAGVYRPTLLATMARRTLQPIQSMTAGLKPSLKRHLRTLIWKVRFMWAAVGLSVKVAAFRPHVIHAHQMRALPVALMLKKVFRRPVIYVVPCLLSQMNDEGTGWLADTCRERHDEIDLFFTGSSVGELRGLGIPEHKIRPIEGGVDVPPVVSATARGDENRRAVRVEIGAKPDCALILSVGRLHRSKGHDYALEAMPAVFQAIPDAHWVVLGVGEAQTALATRVRTLGVASRVHLLGFREDPLPYYAAADVFLRTNIFEGENGSSYLAMAAALPVVGFDTGRENELIPTAGHGFLVPNRNSGALAARTIEILSSPGKGRVLGERGASYAREHLDTAPALQIFFDAYRSLRAGRA